jgi:hypothetical protein
MIKPPGTAISNLRSTYDSHLFSAHRRKETSSYITTPLGMAMHLKELGPMRSPKSCSIRPDRSDLTPDGGALFVASPARTAVLAVA